ncbi:spore germination protein [Pelotomaculum propionicicum]|uniref:Spore germination protein A1 n=1 Tax=Pelotomaculum propionicicum TaxID=258475 RepID=A0A4Y7RUV3_9FIRM|nr:spore germination protein [Pelotomaculum propionicicum]NLI13428.1 spore germination protein [Peptococcaceae bacterium]TEB12778.1 Spore germination protein A1 [Pelotomaculum propionicicum]
MFKLFLTILRRINGRKTKIKEGAQSHWETTFETERRPISSSLEKNKAIVKEIFDRCDDLVIREIIISRKSPVRALVVYLDPMVNPDLLQHNLLRALLNVDEAPSNGITIAWLKEKVIPAGDIQEKKRWVEVGNGIAKGLVGIFVEGQGSVLLTSIFEDVSRSISQPTAEPLIRGPADAFNEDLRTNIALLRKRLHTTRLAVENLEIGELSKTAASLVYLKGYVTDELIHEVKERIQRIKIDGAHAGGYHEEFLQDNPYSLFNPIEPTERPDKLYGHLLEGAVGLMFENTPFAIIFPVTLPSQIQSPEDYYNHYWFASFIRLFRWAGFFFAIFLPSFYIAITTYHQELVPTPLLISIIASREGVPFPGFLEALLMELAFELLTEAGVRLPRAFGQTISIVGGIVIGQAAVNASLVSPILVIVVALTAVATYTIPSITLSNTVRMLRFPFMIAAAFMGLFGVVAGSMLLIFHLCSLRSFGVPYLSPLAPLSMGDLKDTFIRAPAWMMIMRPRLTGYVEPQRQPRGQKPRPPAPEGNRSLRWGRKK